MYTLAIMATGNDADIIELSVRHNLSKVDEILAIDNNSTDGTKDILETLTKEYNGRLKILNVHNKNSQDSVLTLNLFKEQIKLSDNPPDFLFVIDADEFIHADNFDELLTIPANHVGVIKWKTYIPSSLDHKDYPLEMTNERSREPEYAYKVIIPKNVNGMLMLGSHCIHYNNKRIPSIKISSMYLAHYPVRNIKQMNRKIRFATEFAKNEEKSQVFHLRNIKEIESLDELINMAVNYGFKRND